MNGLNIGVRNRSIVALNVVKPRKQCYPPELVVTNWKKHWKRQKEFSKLWPVARKKQDSRLIKRSKDKERPSFCGERFSSVATVRLMLRSSIETRYIGIAGNVWIVKTSSVPWNRVAIISIVLARSEQWAFRPYIYQNDVPCEFIVLGAFRLDRLDVNIAITELPQNRPHGSLACGWYDFADFPEMRSARTNWYGATADRPSSHT